MMKYDDMMQLCEMQTPEKSQSTEISRVSYKLVAVVVHIGDKLFSGHYVCYMKRNGSWYFADDTHIKRCSTFEAINQKAYLVFYERDVSDDPVVEISQGISSFSIPSDTEQQPVVLQSHETIQVQHGTPPFFYVKEPWCDIRHPALCRTTKDYPGLQYTPICESEKEQAELIVTMEHTIPQHSRTRGWEGGDLCRLLPGQEGEDSWLSNFLLNKIFVLIEEKATAAGNKVSTLNSDIFLRMATPSKDTYLKYNFHQLYPNIPDSEVILAPFNHGRHWCLVVVNLKENFSVYLDSLYDGAGAQMAFSRVNNFLTCCASINGINTWTLQNWKYFVIPSSDIAQQLNSDDCGVFVAKWAEHISLGLPLDFTQDEIVTFRYSLILDIV